ncbi:cytochrome c oxidase assembly protein [Dasania sp. GY-MA-18]|uniref:Cytochrome c oxidase assembly protein CtaG n=1 Tax=Dasania phycosphaerae TaxID=2950436 RepID=A0A9J6RPQ0_9GAMM|nr:MULTISPECIES: cytochrome c oxidase assembly protein [Dasania]MCR8923847.1 cytochrome c oxidase assembly protein [Dasania sp. GY-MA-18]MCZ0866281.1 cytochrome c oxidase assembly protein [Dasania phycosphaerae]MCZ0870005.1 cytochrome c oxidase assembly protein [Dasania phycosphaerae]
MAEQQQTSISKTVIKLVATVVFMLFFVPLVMVPLYNVLCEQLGINGKTGGRYEVVEAGVDTSRTVTVQFVATINDQMPWQFRPTVTELKVHPGAINSTVFYAKNPRDYNMVAQAIPSLTPGRATQYFHKTECFCFNQQPLAGGAETEMPLQFIVDRDLPADIKTITLSYTIFDVTEMVKKPSVASR